MPPEPMPVVVYLTASAEPEARPALGGHAGAHYGGITHQDTRPPLLGIELERSPSTLQGDLPGLVDQGHHALALRGDDHAVEHAPGRGDDRGQGDSQKGQSRYELDECIATHTGKMRRQMGREDGRTGPRASRARLSPGRTPEPCSAAPWERARATRLPASCFPRSCPERVG